MDNKCPFHDEFIGDIRKDISGACAKIQRLDKEVSRLVEANRERIENEKSERVKWQFRIMLVVIILAFLSGADTLMDALRFLNLF
jgi:hypothetical protein